ncbi:hypothetical protein ACA910_005658 [Epithemia clementina (nom. ined.)]
MKTATQLRNSRKRRSLKRKKQQEPAQEEQLHSKEWQSGSSDNSALCVATPPRKRPRHGSSSTTTTLLDPSLQYIQDPMQAPVIQQARAFFANICSTTTTAAASENCSNQNKKRKDLGGRPNNGAFPIHMSGPKYHWRTLVKLAVRPSSTLSSALSLGLFAPKTHELVPQSGPTCPLHHPVLNQALTCVQHLARQLHVLAYTEATRTTNNAHATSFHKNSGSLKYVTASLERSTQRVQLTLVWQEGERIRNNSGGREGDQRRHGKSNVHDDGDDDEIKGNVVLHKLCDAIIRDGTTTTSPKATADNNNNAQSSSKKKSKQPQHTTKNENSGSSSSWLHSLWVHVHPFGFSRHNNAIYAIPNNKDDGGGGDGGGTWEIKYGPGMGTQEMLELQLELSPPQQQQQLRENRSNPPTFTLFFKPTLFFPPTVFRQANLDAFGKIVGQIRTFLVNQQQEEQGRRRASSSLSKADENQSHRSKTIGATHQTSRSNHDNNEKPHLLELYGGVGTIGLHLTDLCASYTCSDENPHNQAAFDRAVQSLSSQPPNPSMEQHKQKTTTTTNNHDNNQKTNPSSCHIRYVPRNATDMVQHDKSLEQADWIIVDPPRKGLEPVVCRALTNNKCRASVLIYVSCGFPAFCRDYQQLTAPTRSPQLQEQQHRSTHKRWSSSSSSSWELVDACGHVLFPGSNALETLAFFRRRP